MERIEDAKGGNLGWGLSRVKPAGRDGHVQGKDQFFRRLSLGPAGILQRTP